MLENCNVLDFHMYSETNGSFLVEPFLKCVKAPCILVLKTKKGNVYVPCYRPKCNEMERKMQYAGSISATSFLMNLLVQGVAT